MENNTEQKELEVLGQTGVIDTVVEKKEEAPVEKVHKMDLKTLFLLGLGVVALIVVIIILIMSFTGKKLTVSFDTDGGSKIQSVIVKKGKKVAKPKNPTKEDYTFIEWQLDGQKYDFNKEVTRNIKLKAKWEIKLTDDIYTITFNSVGGSEVEEQKINGNGQVIEPDAPTKTHSKFVEWQLDGETYDFNSLVKSDMTLTAVWEPVSSYNIKVDYDEGGNNYTQVVYEGDLVTTPFAPKKDGYKFIEWQKDGQTYNFETPVAEDFTLKAIYEKADMFVISFNTDGGSSVQAQKLFEDSVVVKPVDPKKDGYTFAGWFIKNGDKEEAYDFNTPVKSDIELKAKWAEAKICKVTFVRDGVTDEKKTVEIPCGTKLSSANEKFYEAFKNTCQSVYENNPLNANNCLEKASLDSNDYGEALQNGSHDVVINKDGTITFWFMNYGN